MVEIRTATRDDLPGLLAFERRYTERDASLPEFRQAFEQWPELFVLAVEGDELVGGASGTADGERVELASIAVVEDRRGEGVGRALLAAFEDRARTYGETVSLASADDVEGFYRSAGYEPGEVLLQVETDALPDGYADADPIVRERSPEPGVTFLYAEFETYDPALRDELRDRFGAFEANTIYEKELTD